MEKAFLRMSLVGAFIGVVQFARSLGGDAGGLTGQSALAAETLLLAWVLGVVAYVKKGR